MWSTILTRINGNVVHVAKASPLVLDCVLRQVWQVPSADLGPLGTQLEEPLSIRAGEVRDMSGVAELRTNTAKVSRQKKKDI